jgi:hypothetical protein
MHLPEDHPGRYAHPAYLDIGDLTPEQAGWIIKAILLTGLVGAAWVFRKPFAQPHASSPEDDARTRETLLWELAALNVLMLLYSPITWGQHFVATLPAFYLLTRRVATRPAESRLQVRLLAGLALLIFATNRGFIGRDLSKVIDSYHVITFAMLPLVAGLFFSRPSRGAAVAAGSDASPKGVPPPIAA